MDIVIQDANILIDLISSELIDDFFKLPLQVYTTDLIVNEITDSKQKKIINGYIKKGYITVLNFSFDEMIEISGMLNKNLTMPDGSVWFAAKKYDAVLLTGDARLRKSAEDGGVRVKGLIYIFDALVENKVITVSKAKKKLKEITTRNTRLPRKEIEKRLGGYWE